MFVSFGSLPLDATFSIMDKQRDPADRRRWRWVRVYLRKCTHGSIAGFADNSRFNLSRRFSHSDHVMIDPSDLRLVVTCVQRMAQSL